VTNNTGKIEQVANDGDFDFSILGVGTYDVFVLNYRTTNEETTSLAYLAQLMGGTTNGTGGNIMEIVADDMDASSYGLSIGSTTIPNPTSFGMYAIDYDMGAEAAGFVDIPNTTVLPTKYEIPAGIVSGIYSGTFKYSDANDCEGEDDFVITINNGK